MMVEQALTHLSNRMERGEVAVYLGPDLDRALTGVPSWTDLARELAIYGGFEGADSWPRMASRYLNRFGKNDLKDFLDMQLDQLEPGPIYSALAALPVNQYVCATYDEFLEQALEQAGPRPNLVVKESHLNYIKSDRSSVIRLLGGISNAWREEMLFTAADLMSLPEKKKGIINKMVLPAFVSQTMLIVGQNLNADYFRNLYFMGLPQDSTDRRRAYALWSGLEEWEHEEWTRAKVNVIGTDPLEFLRRLRMMTVGDSVRDGAAESASQGIDKVKPIGDVSASRPVEVHKGIKPEELEEEDSYANFDLSLSIIRDVCRVESSGTQGEGLHDHEVSAVRDPALKALLGRLRNMEAGEEDVGQLGQILREILFPQEIWTKYREELGATRDAAGLRIRLNFHQNESELIGLPWEYCRDDRDYFALNTRTPIVRYLKTDLAPLPIAVPDPVRVLIVTASPAGYESETAREEAELIRKSLLDLNTSGEDREEDGDDRVALSRNGRLSRVEVKAMDQANMLSMDEEINLRGGFGPHIIHFIGHGIIENGQGRLILDDGQGKADPVSAAKLLRMLRDRRSQVRVAILNASQTAAYLSDQAIAGLAPRLVWGGVPAVVAMQFPVPDKMATVFAGDLFRSLAQGAPLDEAVSTARRRASFAGIFQWGIPVLYMRSPDGVIWTK